VLSVLQRIPAPGDSSEFEGRRYTVIDLDNLRVGAVKIEALQPQPQSPLGGALELVAWDPRQGKNFTG
jgi:CBS domain containing-hemolysin-like protein